jgi:Ca-activated chloride channel family protein
LLSPESLPATPQNLAKASKTIDYEHGGGGTELLPALQRALALPGARDAARSIVVITDGYVDVEAQAFELIRANLNRANLFAFGIGSSVNRHLIEGMAHAGLGEPFIVTAPSEAEGQVNKFREYISAPVLTHVAADFGGFEVYDQEPRSIPDVLADRPVVLFGKWKGEATGTITVRGKTGAGEFVQSFQAEKATRVESSPALSYLWARSRIATLADFNELRPNDERVREVTSLGLTYNLLTAYTSFVAVDSEVRNAGGQLTSVKQPLPLPEGVENSAVGGAPLSTTPEPPSWLLLLTAMAVLGFHRLRRRACV